MIGSMTEQAKRKDTPMALCIHNLVPTTCWCCLYGAYAPTLLESFGQAAPLFDYPEEDFWGKEGGGGGCPSEQAYQIVAEYEHQMRVDECAACMYETEGGQVYDDHTCIETGVYVRRATKQYPPKGRPRWMRIEFSRSPAFLGFYRSDLDAIAGHGVDPAFMSVH